MQAARQDRVSNSESAMLLSKVYNYPAGTH